MNIKDIVSTFPINDPVMWVDQYSEEEVWGTVAGYALNSVGETVIKINRVMPIEVPADWAQRDPVVYLHPGNRPVRLTNILTGETLVKN